MFGMNAFGTQWCDQIFTLHYTSLKMAVLLHKTALNPKGLRLLVQVSVAALLKWMALWLNRHFQCSDHCAKHGHCTPTSLPLVQSRRCRGPWWNSGYSGSDPASNINNLRSDKIVRALAATAAVDAEAAVDGHALRAG